MGISLDQHPVWRETVRLLFGLLVLVVSSPSWCADKLPLKRGIFVDANVKCSERSNATVTSFWGDELNSSQVRGTIRSVVKRGKSYTVVLDTEEIRNGNRSRETWNVTIPSPTRMKIDNQFGSWTQRWCSKAM